MAYLFSLFWFLLVGLAAGWAASMVMKGRDFGLLGNLIVGVTGAVLGGFVFGLIGPLLSLGGLFGQLIVAFLGAMLFLYLLGFASRARG